MSWMVLYMTVIFPLLLAILLVMDLVDFEIKPHPKRLGGTLRLLHHLPHRALAVCARIPERSYAKDARNGFLQELQPFWH